MNRSRLRRSATLMVLAFAVLAVSACGSNGEPQPRPLPGAAPPEAAAPPQGTIKVALAEYSLKPTPAEAKAGKVTFDVENAGAMNHEFIVIKTDKKAADLLKGEEADEKGSVDEIGDIEAGKSAKLSVKLKPGHYALICNLPGHYMPGGQPGMLADFTVK